MKKTLLCLLSIMLTGQLWAQTEVPNTLSKTEKIFGLSKFWNEVNFNFAYLNKVDKKQWEADYKSMIEAVQTTANDYEYYRLLQKFAATLKDGHTNVELPVSFSKFMLNSEFGDTKWSLEWIDDKVLITEINKSKRKQIPVGSEIIEVNGMATSDYLDTFVKPYIASSTAWLLDAISVSHFMFNEPIGTTFDVRLQTPKGNIISKQLTLSPSQDMEMFPEKEDKGVFEFKWLENKTAYIGIHSFGNGKVDSLFKSKLPELKTAKQLIIDLRENLGGDSGYAQSIFKHLTNDEKVILARSLILDYNPLYEYYGVRYNLQAKDTTHGNAENRKELRRAYLTAQDSYFHEIPYNTIPNDVPKSDRVVIPTAILIGPYSASSSEDFLVYTDNQKHMVKIGEASAGTTGMPMSIAMPGGGRARICFKKEIYADGREFVGYGIQPDVKVKATYKDYLEQKDVVLETAMKHLDKS